MNTSEFSISKCLEVLAASEDRPHDGITTISNKVADAIGAHLTNYQRMLAEPPAIPAAYVERAKAVPNVAHTYHVHFHVNNDGSVHVEDDGMIVADARILSVKVRGLDPYADTKTPPFMEVGNGTMRETCEGLENDIEMSPPLADTYKSARESLETATGLQIARQPSSLDFLDKAKAIQAERGTEYNKPGGERNMGKIVTAFNAITGHNISETDGWAFMSILKQVRLFSNREKAHADSCVDFVSYAALQAESAVRNGV